MDINREGALAEAAEIKGYFEKFGAALPAELEEQRKLLEERASKAPTVWTISSAA